RAEEDPPQKLPQAGSRRVAEPSPGDQDFPCKRKDENDQ
ncbi:jg26927, partial [Pararge aegeria aegeria]